MADYRELVDGAQKALDSMAVEDGKIPFDRRFVYAQVLAALAIADRLDALVGVVARVADAQLARMELEVE